MLNVERISVASATDFQNERMKGVGGSDVAGILGVSKWSTPLSIYQSKMGLDKPDPSKEMLFFLGHAMEEPIAQAFQKLTGLKVQHFRGTLASNLGKGEELWARANIDRVVINEQIAKSVCFRKTPKNGSVLTTDSILEIKTASSYTASEWGPSQANEIIAGRIISQAKIPEAYYCQCQWYLAVTGVQICFVAALIGGNDLRVYALQRDEEFISLISEKCFNFYMKHMKSGEAPDPQNSGEVISLFPKDNGETVVANNLICSALNELEQVKSDMATLKEKEEAIKNQIASFIKDAAVLTDSVGKQLATFKTVASKRFDSSNFKKDNPELYGEYLKESSTRVLRIC